MIDKNKMGVEVNINTKSTSESSPESGTPTLSTPKTEAIQTQADSPFRIAVLGDFSGRANSSQYQPETLGKRRLIEVDRDNFEEVMAGFNISLSLNLQGNESIQLDINELDDFHPDELYEKLESFSKLRSLRRRLKNNKTFDEAAAEIQGWLPESKQADKVAEPSNEPSADNNVSADNLLDDILGAQQETASKVSAEANHIDRLIKSIVAPYVEPAADPRQNEMLSMVDQAIEKHMRDILHHSDFQAIESAWQSLYFLVKRLETGAKLKIILLDISWQEFQGDLLVDDITTSAIYRRFCDTTEGDLPWSILLGNYYFTDTVDDVLTLSSAGAIAKQAQAPFIAAASEKLAGCESFNKTPDYEDWNYEISDVFGDAWEMLRESPVAGHIGLALPRFLLRLPYGKKSKPIDAFDFEEMDDGCKHEHYLWGNAGFVKAELLARNFKEKQWEMQPGEVHQTDNLPIHYYQDEGETVSKPIAEIQLTEKGGGIIAEHGLMTLWSVKNMDAIRSADFRSIANNGEKIAGRWK